eukprot:jgi/Undpi1/10040/HiC_scaffold_28.g12494.m1
MQLLKHWGASEKGVMGAVVDGRVAESMENATMTATDTRVTRMRLTVFPLRPTFRSWLHLVMQMPRTDIVDFIFGSATPRSIAVPGGRKGTTKGGVVERGGGESRRRRRTNVMLTIATILMTAIAPAIWRRLTINRDSDVLDGSSLSPLSPPFGCGFSVRDRVNANLVKDVLGRAEPVQHGRRYTAYRLGVYDGWPLGRRFHPAQPSRRDAVSPRGIVALTMARGGHWWDQAWTLTPTVSMLTA